MIYFLINFVIIIIIFYYECEFEKENNKKRELYNIVYIILINVDSYLHLLI